jgi:C4-dicarboxylate transporter
MALVTAATFKVGDPLTFYAVAATIIPVFYLAFVFQTRYFERVRHASDSSEGQDRAEHLQLPIFFALLGEVASMSVLASQHPTDDAKRITSVALVVLGAFLVMEPVLVLIKPVDDSADELGWWPWLRLARILPPVVYVVTAFVTLRLLQVF